MLEKIIQQAWPEWKVVDKRIGKGAFGSVYKVDKVNGISMPSAVKVISVPRDESEIDSLNEEGYSEEQTSKYFKECLSSLEKEIEIMAKLKYSNNIVKIEDYKIIEKEDDFGWYILVRMELLTPLTAIQKTGVLSEEEVIKLGIDICTALELCEKEGVIHRDIKPANIFCDQYKNYKLGDFGIARELGSSTVKTIAGNEPYMAPEVLFGKYDSRADIYSLGLVLYCLLNNNNLPFLNDETKLNPEKKMEAIKRRLEGNDSLPAPLNASEEMADLIAWACLYDKEGKWKLEGRGVPNTAKRIENASQLKEELEDVLSGKYVLRENRTFMLPKGQNKTQGDITEPKKVKNNNKKIIFAIIALLLLIGGGGAFGAILLDNEEKDASKGTEDKSTEISATVEPITAKPIAVTTSPTATIIPEEVIVTPEPEAHEHDYVKEDVREANCGQEGEVKYSCLVCDDSYTEVISMTGEHTYEDDMDVSCDVCGEVRRVGHEYESIVTKAATCGEAGVKTSTCVDCGDSYTEVIAATGKHSYKNACAVTCDVCGETRKIVHDYESKVTKKATCNEKGVKTYTCSVCGDSYTEVISATGEHSYKNACDATCDVCRETRKVVHDYESKVTKKATCNVNGVKTYACSVCGDSYTEAIAATGKHSYVLSSTREATCGKSGENVYTCPGCDDSYTEVIAATGKHSYVNACDVSCDVCGKTRTVEHTWKPATCTAAKTCTVCSTTEGSANGHKFSSSTDITCDVCNTVCGYLEKGEWSEWQDEEIVPSDNSIEVDKNPEVLVGYNQKLKYKYTRFYGWYEKGGYYLGLGYSSGICTTFEETIWLDEPLPWNKVWSNAQNRYNEGYGYGYTADGKTGGKKIFWYNQKSEPFDDLNSPIYKTQYRYREVYAVYY